MSKFAAADTLALPLAERVHLVADIWDTIAATPEALPVTEDLTQIDRSRLRRFHEMEAMTVPRSMQSSTPSRIARWPMSLTAHPI